MRIYFTCILFFLFVYKAFPQDYVVKNQTDHLSISQGTAGINVYGNDIKDNLGNLFLKAINADASYLKNGAAAGGDLTGTYPNPTVAQLNGQAPSYYLNYNNLTNKPSFSGFLTLALPNQSVVQTPNFNAGLSSTGQATFSKGSGYYSIFTNDNVAVGSLIIQQGGTFNGVIQVPFSSSTIYADKYTAGGNYTISHNDEGTSANPSAGLQILCSSHAGVIIKQDTIYDSKGIRFAKMTDIPTSSGSNSGSGYALLTGTNTFTAANVFSASPKITYNLNSTNYTDYAINKLATDKLYASYNVIDSYDFNQLITPGFQEIGGSPISNGPNGSESSSSINYSTINAVTYDRGIQIASNNNYQGPDPITKISWRNGYSVSQHQWGVWYDFYHTGNLRTGNIALSSGTVTIQNSSITAKSIITVSYKTISGSPGFLSYTINPGTSFTVNSTAQAGGTQSGDNSLVSYIIVN